MASYSKEFKASIIQRMMPPNNVSVTQLKKETGITDATLYTWRKQAKAQGVPVPGDGKNPDQWTAQDKFSVLMETASLNATELYQSIVVKRVYSQSKLLNGNKILWTEVHSPLNRDRFYALLRSKTKNVSRSWSVNFAARIKRWQKQPPYWFSQKKHARSGGK